VEANRILRALNGAWHRAALQAFMVVVLAHWAEHLFQAYQVYVMEMPRPHSLGALGMVFPWLVHSEWLHFGYALVMLAGLYLLRHAFVGRAARWWTVALVIQAWHLVEHSLLLGQVLLHRNLFGAAMPTSILQLALPRIELHLFYNAIVFFPMLWAVVLHARPSAQERQLMNCSCARRIAPAV
jgi:hypothetical protein